jgi:PST family polysaccharide transporter
MGFSWVKILFKFKKSTFTANILSLSYLQFLTMTVPIIMLPIIVRSIGYEKYGQLMLASAGASYIAYLIDYGFNLLGTREIAQNKDDLERVKQIHSSIFFSKALIGCLLFLVLSFISFLRLVNVEVFLLYAAAVCIKSFIPTWMYRGLEKVYDLVLYTTVGQLFYVALIFWGLGGQDDYLLVPISLILANIVTLLFSGVWLHKKRISLVLVPFSAISGQLRSAWPFFLSNISTAGYTSSTIIILGVFASDSTVGAYAAAEKLIMAASGIMAPILQAAYPLMARISEQNIELFKKDLKRLARVAWVLGSAIAFALYFLNEAIVSLLFSNSSEITIHSLGIMCLIPLISFLGNLYGVNTLLTHKREGTYVTILVVFSLIHIGLSISLTHLFGWIGTVTTVVLTQMMISISMYVAAKRVLC